jgi:hypothetical protein
VDDRHFHFTFTSAFLWIITTLATNKNSFKKKKKENTAATHKRHRCDTPLISLFFGKWAKFCEKKRKKYRK